MSQCVSCSDGSPRQVPQAVEVLALKQDSVVHRCLEGIKARLGEFVGPYMSLPTSSKSWIG